MYFINDAIKVKLEINILLTSDANYFVMRNTRFDNNVRFITITVAMLRVIMTHFYARQ